MSQLKRILIVGALGQLGRELQRSFDGTGELICYSRGEVDVADSEQVREMVRAAAPDVILNAAAFTAVDRAESEKELATAINATAPRVLAEEAKRHDILLVHFSTDYVFDGTKRTPWVESDRPNPLNYYGISKLDGERAVQDVGGRYLIFRTSWVYASHGKNFLLTMLRMGKERDQLAVVDDQYGAPTTSVALANATRSVVEGIFAERFGGVDKWAGLYHMTCAGQTTWCGFAEDIFRRGKPRMNRVPEILPIPTSEYPSPTRRPLYSILSNQKLYERFGVRLADWRDELDSILQLVS